MSSNSDAVRKGLEYEDKVVNALREWGLDAHKTNIANPDDPEEYKRGFDGGVDVIARYSANTKVKKEITFYIQCKNHEKNLLKSAIAEAYTGMHARKNRDRLSYPVVISKNIASQETIQYAKSVGVELITATERNILQYIKVTGSATYANYGPLMKIIIYNYTKDPIWIETLPENGNPLSDVAMTEKLIEQSKIDFDHAQSYLDDAQNLERQACEARQKALDIQKMAAFRVLQTCGLNKQKSNKNKDDIIPADDSG